MESYNNVFDAVMDTPEEALNMKLRAKLMNEIIDHVNAAGWNQKQAAKYLGVTQPRISDLLRCKIDLFSLDMLINMLAVMGSEVEITIKTA